MFLLIVLGIIYYVAGDIAVFKFGIILGALIAIIKGYIEGASARKAKREQRRAQKQAAEPKREKHMGLVERWRDEERRMAEAEEAKARLLEQEEEEWEEEEIDEVEEEPEEVAEGVFPEPVEEEPVVPVVEGEVIEDDEDAVCVFCGATEEDDEDESFCEKELSRLYKVRNGLEIKVARMLYMYRVNDPELSEDARSSGMAKLEATKAWRGLQFDLRYVNNEILGLEEYIKRGA